MIFWGRTAALPDVVPLGALLGFNSAPPKTQPRGSFPKKSVQDILPTPRQSTVVVLILKTLILGHSQGKELASSLPQRLKLGRQHPNALAQRTEANEAERLAADARSAGGHLPDLLHALHPRPFPQRLVEPRVPPVEVEDVADGGVGRLLHGGRGDVADGDPCRGNNRGSGG